MTQRDTLECLHEPFGDAFYYGPERISPRYEDDEKDRIASGYAESTYKTIVDRIEHEAAKVCLICLSCNLATQPAAGQASLHQGHHVLSLPSRPAGESYCALSPDNQARCWHRRCQRLRYD